MTKRIACTAALCLWIAAVPGFTVGKVVGLETGYAYLVSAQGLQPQNGSGVLVSLYYGYLVGDKPRSSTLLSLALGYGVFPEADSLTALHSLIYGLEYAHTFFRDKPVSLMIDYGLLFNMLLEVGRKGYAFGHHSRLGLGPVFRLSARDSLALQGTYNFVAFPHFEQASDRFTYPAAVLRYQHSF